MSSKIVEAKLVISGEDRASAAVANVVKTFKDLEAASKVSKPLQEVARTLLEVEKAERAVNSAMAGRNGLAALQGDLQKTQAVLAQTATALDAARRAKSAFDGVKLVKGSQEAQAAQNAAKAVREAGAAYRAAERDVRKVNAAISAQTATVQQAERAAAAFGADLGQLEAHQIKLKRNIEATTGALRQQITAEEQAAKVQAARQVRRDAQKAVVSGAGVYVGHKVSERTTEVAHSYERFDDLIKYQAAVADLNSIERKSRRDQAVHIGATSRYNDLQVLETQLTLAQRGVKKDFVEPFVGEIVNYAQAMNTDLPSAAKTLEGVIFSTNQNVENAATALGVMRKNVDLLVKTAKVGGLDNEGVAQAFKFGGAAGASAGLSNVTMGTIFAALHKAGYEGSEAGVATRAIASKLVAPTSKGLAALSAMGIDYNAFTKMPGGLSADALSGKVRQDFGKDLSPDQKRRIQQAMDEQTFTDEKGGETSIVADRGQFTAAIAEIVAESFPKNKKGETSATDMKNIAKKVGEFHKLSVESVDAEGLLGAILAKNPTLAQANAFGTDKHGSKITALAKKLKDFEEIREALAHVEEGFGKRIGDARMSGFAGARKRLEGSRLNVDTAIGRALDNDGEGGGVLTTATDALARLTQHVAELDPKILAVGSSLAVLGGKAAETAGTFGLAYSAMRLTGSAAALDAAALKLAGVPGSTLPAAAKGVPAFVGFGLGASTVGVLGAGAFAGYATAQTMPGVVKEKGPGGMDAATGGSVEESPMTGLAPDRPWLADWWRSHAPVILGGEPAKEAVREAGKEAGHAAGEGVAAGVREKSPEIEAQGKSLFERFKAIFAEGIRIPIGFTPGDGAAGGGGDGRGLIHRASFGGMDSVDGGGVGGIVRGGRDGGGAGGVSGGGFGGSGGAVRRGGLDLSTKGADPEVAAYIREAAKRNGIDPDVATAVANSEALRAFDPKRPDKGGDNGTSFGPFQLHYGGGTGANRQRGLGDRFTEQTGKDARDASTWRDQVDFALKTAKREGWGAWHGARNTGIGPWDGLRGDGAGLRVKGGPGGQAFGGGETHPSLLAIAKDLQKAGGVNRFTAFNDRYHAGSRSKHASGLAADVTGDPARIMANAREVMAAAGMLEGRDFRLIDEYARPSAGATGGHVHFEFRSRRAADAFARGRDLDRPPPGPKMPDGKPMEVLEAPAGGFGGGGRGDMAAAAERMHAAVDRMENVGWRSHHTVEVTTGAGLQARTKGMRVSASGPVKADVGVTMPGARGGDWI